MGANIVNVSMCVARMDVCGQRGAEGCMARRVHGDEECPPPSNDIPGLVLV